MQYYARTLENKLEKGIDIPCNIWYYKEVKQGHTQHNTQHRGTPLHTRKKANNMFTEKFINQTEKAIKAITNKYTNTKKEGTTLLKAIAKDLTTLKKWEKLDTIEKKYIFVRVACTMIPTIQETVIDTVWKEATTQETTQATDKDGTTEEITTTEEETAPQETEAPQDSYKAFSLAKRKVEIMIILDRVVKEKVTSGKISKWNKLPTKISRHYGKAFEDLSGIIANSTIKTVIDPQRNNPNLSNDEKAYSHNVKTGSYNKEGFFVASEDNSKTFGLLSSNSGFSSALTPLKNQLYFDTIGLEIIRDNPNAPQIQETLSEGMDIKQEASLFLCEVIKRYSEQGFILNWLDQDIDSLQETAVDSDSEQEEQEEQEGEQETKKAVTPIRLAYRGTRKHIDHSRAVQTSQGARQKYCYIEDVINHTSNDSESRLDVVDKVYFRCGKYTDLGSMDSNGNYTVDQESVDECEKILDLLDLTPTQEQILNSRLEGDSFRTIGKNRGVTFGAIYNTMQKVQKKAEKLGFTPVKEAKNKTVVSNTYGFGLKNVGKVDDLKQVAQRMEKEERAVIYLQYLLSGKGQDIEVYGKTTERIEKDGTKHTLFVY